MKIFISSYHKNAINFITLQVLPKLKVYTIPHINTNFSKDRVNKNTYALFAAIIPTSFVVSPAKKYIYLREILQH